MDRARDARRVASRTVVALALVSAACGEGGEAPKAGEARQEVEGAGRREVAEVAWPAAAAVDREALERLPEASRAAIQKAPVPVLVPSDPALLERAVVLAEPAWAAVSTRLEGLTVAVHATHVAVRYAHVPKVEGQRPMRGVRGFVTRDDDIWTASWLERGVSYGVSVECYDRKDARCADEAYLLDLVEKLTYVGGAGPEARP